MIYLGRIMIKYSIRTKFRPELSGRLIVPFDRPSFWKRSMRQAMPSGWTLIPEDDDCSSGRAADPCGSAAVEQGFCRVSPGGLRTNFGLPPSASLCTGLSVFCVRPYLPVCSGGFTWGCRGAHPPGTEQHPLRVLAPPWDYLPTINNIFS